ncbi:MAG TPA: hypothetical protein VD886_04195 [Herpetosiphonaceae bacterium]|nr:hypothetical protein [Herpetosiphonaceae bacterium]
MTDFMTIPADTLVPASPETMAAAGSAADRAAARYVFTDYRARKSANTIRRHDDELVLLTRFLAEIGIVAGDLSTDPDA